MLTASSQFGSVTQRAIGACRTGWQRSRAALREWAALESNPFLALGIRRESRRSRPILTLLGLCALVGLLLMGGGYAQSFFAAPDAPLPPNGFRRAVFSLLRATEGGFPNALGRNIVGFVALVTLGVSAFFVSWAARTRANAPLRSASLGGSLEDWQLLPLAEERWVWMLAAHPFAVALLCAIGGFPAYALAIFTGVWSLRDLLGILVLFVWLGHLVPRWTPRLWQGRGAKFNTKKYTQLVKEARGGRPMSDLSPEERFEVERRVARALMDSYDTPSSRRAGRGTSNLNTWFAQIAVWMFATQGLLPLVILSSRSGGLSNVLPLAYRVALPTGTLELLPAFPLTWPLLVARILTAPFPFFALTLPPLVLLLPLSFSGFNVRFLTLASQVSASETFWTRKRTVTRRVGQAVSGLLLVAIIVGYGWPLFITRGLMARALWGAPRPLTMSAALTGGWTLFGVLGALIASGRPLEEPFRQARMMGLARGRAWREALVGALSSWFIALGMFLFFCLLGAVRNFGADWRAHALPVLLTCGAFLTVEFGCIAFKTSLPTHLRHRAVWLRAAWFYGPIIVYACVAIYSGIFGQFVTVFDAPWLLVSPWVALVALFRFDLAPPAVPFALSWLWPAAANFAFGTVLILGAAAREFAGLRGVETAPGEGSLSWWGRFKATVRRVALWLVWVIGRIPAWIALGYEAAIVALLRPFDRAENPILRDEMRRRVRREAWLVQWLAAIIGVVWLVWQFGLWPLLSNTSASALVGWGETTLLITVIGACIGALAGPVKLGVCLDRERANGQLAFLFLTPLTEREILLGKWLPELVHSLGLYVATLLPLFMGTGTLILGGASWGLLAFVGVIACMSVALAWSTLAQLAAAVKARKSGEGANRAALVIFGFEFACVLILLLAARLFGSGTPTIVVMGVVLLALHIGAAYGAWRLALRWLRAARYGEGSSTGTVSN